MRLKKLLPIAIGGGIGGLILIFVIIMAVYPNLFVRGLIMEQLEEKFGGRAKAEEVHFGWSSGVTITNLFIQSEDGERPILKAESIELKFPILPILRGELIIDRLVVKHPEMVIYRGEPSGNKGPDLDGAPELEPGKARSSAKRRKRRFKLPSITVMEILDGTFVFTDLYSGESTKVENLNLVVSGIKSGARAKVNGSCDIIGGGGQDHAVISGEVEGYELAAIGSLNGNLNFKSGFAEVAADIDMRRAFTPGEEVITARIKADLQKTITRLGAILALPEDVEIKGIIDSETSAVAQSKGVLRLKGRTTVASLYLDIKPFMKRPFKSSTVELSHHVEVDHQEGVADIKTLTFDSDNADLDLTGTLQIDGTVDVKLHMAMPFDELLLRAADRYASVGQIKADGDFTGDLEFVGSVGDVMNVKGTCAVKDLDLDVKSFRYNDPNVSVDLDMEYDHHENLVRVKNADLVSGLVMLRLEDGLLTLGDDRRLKGSLNVACQIDEVHRFYKLPPSLQLAGVCTVNLDISGPIGQPFYKDLVASGTVEVDRAVYENYTVSKIIARPVTLTDNHLSSTLGMDVNGGPVDVTLDADLIVEGSESPHVVAKMDAKDVQVSHKLSKGEFSGIVTVHVERFEADGIHWDETFKKTLKAHGTLGMKKGKISGIETLDSLLGRFGSKGMVYKIDSLTTDFEVKDEKVYTPKSESFMVKGSPFDIEIAGWMDFDQNIDYDATVFVPAVESRKTPQEAPVSTSGDTKIGLTIRGTMAKPKVKLDFGRLLDTVLDGKQGLKDIERIFKGIFK
ncbi:MAG: AsmA-like C-terminal region-containing protein [Candidatus Brocadiales bacterium]